MHTYSGIEATRLFTFLTFLKRPQQLTAHQPEYPLQSEEFGGHHKRKFCEGIL